MGNQQYITQHSNERSAISDRRDESAIKALFVISMYIDIDTGHSTLTSVDTQLNKPNHHSMTLATRSSKQTEILHLP